MENKEFKQGKKVNTFFKTVNRDYSIIYVIIVISLVFSLMSKAFYSTDNIMTILRQAAIIAIVAAGQYFVIIGGAFDLSVGSVVGLTSTVCAMFMVNLGWSLGLALFAGILVGSIIGLINGVLVTKFNTPAFIATLGTMSAARGLVFVLTNGYPVINLPKSIHYLGRGYVLKIIPFPVILMFVIFILVYIISEKTKLGRYILAMGGNPEAAYLSGINTAFYKIMTFVLCGTLSGIAGVILTSRLASGQPTSGQGYEFQSIIAVVLGGVSLAGGKGKAFGVLMGAILVTALINGMTIKNISSYYQQILTGVVLVLAVGVDVFRNRARR